MARHAARSGTLYGRNVVRMERCRADFDPPVATSDATSVQSFPLARAPRRFHVILECAIYRGRRMCALRFTFPRTSLTRRPRQPGDRRNREIATARGVPKTTAAEGICQPPGMGPVRPAPRANGLPARERADQTPTRDVAEKAEPRVKHAAQPSRATHRATSRTGADCQRLQRVESCAAWGARFELDTPPRLVYKPRRATEPNGLSFPTLLRRLVMAWVELRARGRRMRRVSNRAPRRMTYPSPTTLSFHSPL